MTSERLGYVGGWGGRERRGETFNHPLLGGFLNQNKSKLDLIMHNRLLAFAYLT